MKLTAILIIAALSNVGAKSYSQTVTLHAEKTPVEKIFEIIERQTGYHFFYKRETIAIAGEVTVSLDRVPVEQALEECLKNQPLTFTIINRTVAIKKKPEFRSESASQFRVQGTVTDKQGTPLPGVSVQMKRSLTGAATDENGRYVLSLPERNDTLVFSLLGFTSKEIAVNGRSVIDVELLEKLTSLDEIVVVGYGSVRKSDLTGAVASVKGEDLASFPVSNPVKALQGRVPGVVVSSNTGAPDGNFSIRIRGTNSIYGNNTPLYIIDGMPGNPASVNSQEVASVEILKDASATAIYGSRGANGVVLITTKRGQEGPTQISYDGSYGIQSQIRQLDMMNAREWATFYNEQQLNDEGKEYFTDEEVNAFGQGRDWQSQIFRNAPMQNHNLLVSAGNKKTQLLVSGSVLLRDGLIPGSLYDKYNLRLNIDHAISDKFDLSLTSSYARTAKDAENSSGGNRGESVIGAAISAPPTLSPYNEDGTYQDLKLAYPFMSNGLRNPVNHINEISSKTKANLLTNNVALTYKPLSGLSLKTSFGLENLDYRTDDYTTSKVIEGTSNASVSTNQETTVINENIANYNKVIGAHHTIDLTAGFTFQQYTGKSLSASGSGYISDVPESYQLQGGSLFGTPSTGYTKWTLMSYLGRINYSYKGRYLMTVSFRTDGSSRYSEGSKWGAFPSAALAWRISDEAFMENVKPISDLKLRIGYGETGSTAIAPYTTLNMLSQGKVPLNGSLYNYYAPGTTLPSDLKWETTSQLNLGIDLSMLNHRLRLTADFYEKNTRDLLNSVALPASLGYRTTIRNIGKIRNRGAEFIIDGDILRTENLDWTLSYNMSFNKNTVVALYEGQDIYGRRVNLAYIVDFVNLLREGEPLGVFYTFRETGYNEQGDLTYEDKDGNDVLTNADKSITGDPNPDFTYGLNSSLRFRNFEFSFFLQGSYGNDIFNVGETANLDLGMGLNLRKEVLYSHWKATNIPEQNAAAKYPRATRDLTLNFSNRFVEDGSYLRLKNVMLAYNLPLQKLGVGNWWREVKVYMSAQNILTFTKYSGMDPEVNSWGSGNSVNLGLDYLTYPNYKSVTFGISVKF